MSSTAAVDVGSLIRQWRQHRRLSQMDLAGDAAISTRHLSFVETGRASPSREMVLKLAERLDVPLRERNRLLTAAGYAPLYRERAFDDPDLGAARQAVQALLAAHEPYPALAIDRHWQLLAANRPREAEQVYRRDLARFPNNGWSLYGLSRSLYRQGKVTEARKVKLMFSEAWSGADVKISSSRF